METIVTRPLLLCALSLVVLWLAIQFGSLVGRKIRPLTGDERDDLGIVINASLTLLALIIGFTFSMSVSRYDQRKNYEEEEANAIGTEYVRADLLPAADAAVIRKLLVQYLDQRILFYTLRDPHQLTNVNSETESLQNEMWSIVHSAAKAQPTAPMALTVSGMNDVLNRQGYTQAAWWNRIPTGAWALMIMIAICCSALIGYSAHERGTLFTFLPLLVSIAFFLIADIDTPRRGVIHVLPQNLISLSQSLHASFAAPRLNISP